MRVSFLTGVLFSVALLLAGCGPTKNYPQASDLMGTYRGQTNIIGVISMTITQDSEGFLCFDTSCGYSGKLKVVKAQGRALGQRNASIRHGHGNGRDDGEPNRSASQPDDDAPPSGGQHGPGGRLGSRELRIASRASSAVATGGLCSRHQLSAGWSLSIGDPAANDSCRSISCAKPRLASGNGRLAACWHSPGTCRIVCAATSATHTLGHAPAAGSKLRDRQMKNARILFALGYLLAAGLVLLAGWLAPQAQDSACRVASALLGYALMAQLVTVMRMPDAGRIGAWATQGLAALITILFGGGNVFWPSGWWIGLSAVLMAITFFSTVAWSLLLKSGTSSAPTLRTPSSES